MDPAYRLLTEDAASRGLRLIGYVATDYARRPPGQVEAEIDRWIKFYPRVRGFFFDQQSPLDREVEYYVALREHARRRMKDALIITNPGSICEKAYFARGVSDAICVFANPQGFRQFEPPAPLPPFGDTRIAALVTNILDEAAMRTVVRDAIAKGIRYLYVGDSPPAPNPYAHLPAYWDQLVKEVASRNEPSGRKQEIKPH
ncbi:MAG: spherulation-specific family 4 protein [Isosphaeraceae bacterium]